MNLQQREYIKSINIIQNRFKENSKRNYNNISKT